MVKFVYFLLFSCILSNFCFAQTTNNNITIEINNIVINDGKIYLAIFSTAESFRKEEPDFLFQLESTNTTMVQTLSIPNGEYVITAIQDANNNGKLDFGLFGIPKELLGISNFNGKGFPSRSFDRHKILIDRSTIRIIINLHRF